jgi:hypothetical protein
LLPQPFATVIAKGKGGCECSIKPESREGSGSLFARERNGKRRMKMLQRKQRSQRHECVHKTVFPQLLKSDSWFQQNLSMAREGDEVALDILWKQYGIDYAKEGGRYE